MSEFLHNLVQRSAGAAESDAIRPQLNPWISYTAHAEALNWGLEPLDSQYPGSDEFTSATVETDLNLDRVPDDQKQSDNTNEVQPRQNHMNQPVIPDRQNYTERSAYTKDNQESESAEHPHRRKIHPAQPLIKPRENMQKNNTDLDIQDKKKPKSEIPESPVIETKEKEYLEKVVERVTEARSEIQKRVQTTHIEIASGKDADIQQESPRKPAFEPALRMIQPQSDTPNPVDIRPRKKTEPEVVIENLTVEVVQEKKAQPVKKVQLPAPGQKESKTLSNDTRKVTGTKLRFGLGQM